VRDLRRKGTRESGELMDQSAAAAAVPVSRSVDEGPSVKAGPPRPVQHARAVMCQAAPFLAWPGGGACFIIPGKSPESP
jgi:hypothetical protein